MEVWTIVLICCWVSSTIIDSSAVVAWRSSYTVEVCKGSYTVEAWTIMLIRCLVLSTIMTPRTREENFLHHVSVEMLPLRGLMYNFRKSAFERAII